MSSRIKHAARSKRSHKTYIPLAMFGMKAQKKQMMKKAGRGRNENNDRMHTAGIKSHDHGTGLYIVH